MTKNPRCNIVINLTRKFLDLDREQSKDDHCCSIDECCCGEGECGLNCCNEDGVKGHCFCGEESVRTKKQDSEWTKAYMDISKHKKTCKICIEDSK